MKLGCGQLRTATAIMLASVATACAAPRALTSEAAPLVVPFMADRDQVQLRLEIAGQPLDFLLDTGVDPSVIDLATARQLGAPLPPRPSGEAAGVGDGRAAIFETRIPPFRIGGRSFDAVEAAAMDMAGLSARAGRPLHGVLGYSFLRGRSLLIDYPSNQVMIFASSAQAERWAANCRRRHRIALRSYEGDVIPVIPDFRFGRATGPVSVDTGSGQSLGLLQAALALPGLREAVAAEGEVALVGARGATSVPAGRLGVPIGFGPFRLPAGEAVHIRADPGSPSTRIANVGNRTLRAMSLSLLLDYRASRMSFLSGCPRPAVTADE